MGQFIINKNSLEKHAKYCDVILNDLIIILKYQTLIEKAKQKFIIAEQIEKKDLEEKEKLRLKEEEYFLKKIKEEV